MKTRDKQALISYVINEYNQIFKVKYERVKLSKRYLWSLLDTYKHSGMCEWCYCCRGLYNNCWQEPYFEGNWGMTQTYIDDSIKRTVEWVAKANKRDGRIAMYTDEIGVHVLIVARDLPLKADYLITFTNVEGLI